MDPKLIDKLFAGLGEPLDPPTRLQRAKDMLIHALGGCRMVPLMKYDPASDQMVEVGLICVSCLREGDQPGGPIH